VDQEEILGHLIDSAANNHQRFVRAQFSSPFVWPGYEQTAWVEVHAYGKRPVAGAGRSVGRAQSPRGLGVIESVPPGKLATPCIIDDHEAAPLEWWMRDYLRHLKHHVEQIEAR
jgi:hypothetical protein